MERNRKIWNELVRLSLSHLRAIQEEDWRAWERIAEEKIERYEELKGLMMGRLDLYERERLLAIQHLEEQIRSELLRKMEETKEKILQMKSARKGIKGYKQGMPSRPRRHFSVKC